MAYPFECSFPEVIDSTMRKTFVSCPYKFFINYCRRLKPKGINPHLHFGGCYAKGLEVTRTSYWQENKSLEEAIRDGGVSILNEWGDYEPPDYGSAANKTLGACLEIHADYFREYHPDSDFIKPVMANGKAAVEFNFALPLAGITHPDNGEPLLYAGKFDMLAEDKEHDGLYFIDDEKTTGQLGNSWAKQFKLCGQMTGYKWGAEAYGYKISGIIIRGVSVQKTAIRHLALMEDRQQWMVERWLDQLKIDAQAMIAMYKSEHFNMSLDDACSSYGGCELLESVCTSKNPETWLKQEFEHNPWSPLMEAL